VNFPLLTFENRPRRGSSDHFERVVAHERHRSPWARLLLCEHQPGRLLADPEASATTRPGIIFREVIGVLRRTTAPACGLAVVVAFAVFPALAAAQGSDTVYDEAGALSGPEEQRVQ
jgi:hypothetical protein